MDKLDFFKQFEVKGISKLNGFYGGGSSTCRATKCAPCPDDPCHDCCSDEEPDEDQY